MILRVDVKPERLRWAREREGIEPDALARRFPRYREWESGDKRPTLKQLEKLATVTHAPISSFFLSQPLEERVPIPDLRTIGDRLISRPSADLLDTVYLCQQRQDWYRDFARMEGEDPLPFVGSASLELGWQMDRDRLFQPDRFHTYRRATGIGPERATFAGSGFGG